MIIDKIKEYILNPENITWASYNGNLLINSEVLDYIKSNKNLIYNGLLIMYDTHYIVLNNKPDNGIIISKYNVNPIKPNIVLSLNQINKLL